MNWFVEKAHAISFWGGSSGGSDTPSGSSFDWLKPASGGTSNSLTTIFARAVNIILFIAAALAVIYLIYSGILYITAAGNPDAAKKGQQGVINAIIGIVIIVLAYVIISAAMNLAQGTV